MSHDFDALCPLLRTVRVTFKPFSQFVGRWLDNGWERVFNTGENLHLDPSTIWIASRRVETARFELLAVLHSSLSANGIENWWNWLTAIGTDLVSCSDLQGSLILVARRRMPKSNPKEPS